MLNQYMEHGQAEVVLMLSISKWQIEQMDMSSVW